MQIAVGAVVVTVIDEIDGHIAAAQLPLGIVTRGSWAGTQEVPFLCCDIEILLGRRHQRCLVYWRRYWRQPVDHRGGHVWKMAEHVGGNRAVYDHAVNPHLARSPGDNRLWPGSACWATCHGYCDPLVPLSRWEREKALELDRSLDP